jgi:hypothetical protein
MNTSFEILEGYDKKLLQAVMGSFNEPWGTVYFQKLGKEMIMQ